MYRYRYNHWDGEENPRIKTFRGLLEEGDVKDKTINRIIDNLTDDDMFNLSESYYNSESDKTFEVHETLGKVGEQLHDGATLIGYIVHKSKVALDIIQSKDYTDNEKLHYLKDQIISDIKETGEIVLNDRGYNVEWVNKIFQKAYKNKFALPIKRCKAQKHCDKCDSNIICEEIPTEGNICCDGHRKMTQKDLQKIKALAEVEAGVYNANDMDTDPTRCKFIKNGCVETCCGYAKFGEYCNKCNSIVKKEEELSENKNMCTVILKSGINAGKICGERSCVEGENTCVKHLPIDRVKFCKHMVYDLEFGSRECGNKIGNSANSACGIHCRSTKNIEDATHRMILEQDKQERKEAKDRKLANKREADSIRCEEKMGNGKGPCQSIGRYEVFRTVTFTMTKKEQREKEWVSRKNRMEDELEEMKIWANPFTIIEAEEKLKEETEKAEQMLNEKYPDDNEEITKTYNIMKCVCGKHLEEKINTKRTYCEAIAKSTGKKCKKIACQGEKYCTTHELYEPVERCGYFDYDAYERCPRDCESLDNPYCKNHIGLPPGDAVDDEEAENLIAEHNKQVEEQQRIEKEAREAESRKQRVKLNIIKEPLTQEQQAAYNKRLEEQMKINNKAAYYGVSYEDAMKLPSYGQALSKRITKLKENRVKTLEELSWTTDSSECTENPENEQNKRKRPIADEELAAVSELTGWTEDQIYTMRAKRIYKRIFTKGRGKKFDVIRTVNETMHALKVYISKANTNANSKYVGSKGAVENLLAQTFHDMKNSITSVIEMSSSQKFDGRLRAIDECKEKIPVLKKIMPTRDGLLEGLPMVEGKTKLKPMNIPKYLGACIDGKESVTKEMKADLKFIEELQQFMNGMVKSKKNVLTAEQKIDKREELYAKYREYFTRYIVRFAKAAQFQKEGRVFGFANYFVDLLNKKELNYEKFQKVFGGKIVEKADQKDKYEYDFDMYGFISDIIEQNKDTKFMDYLDVDISTNFSLDEKYTEMTLEHTKYRLDNGLGLPIYRSSSSSSSTIMDENLAQKYNTSVPSKFFRHPDTTAGYLEKDTRMLVDLVGRQLKPDALLRGIDLAEAAKYEKYTGQHPPDEEDIAREKYLEDQHIQKSIIYLYDNKYKFGLYGR
jgi:hypothetical protein